MVLLVNRQENRAKDLDMQTAENLTGLFQL